MTETRCRPRRSPWRSTNPRAAVRAASPSIAIFAALLVLAGVVLVPILATALNGFKELGDLQSNPFGLPRVWVWQNYWDILTGYRYWQVLGNSLLIALLTVVLTLALSSMAAFTFAHLRFFGDRFLLNYMLLGLLFPAATAILPLFIKIRDLGLLDSYWGIVLPQVAFSLAMSVLLLAQRVQTTSGRIARCGDDGRLRLLPLFLLHHVAAVGADPLDRRRDLFRRQLERLSDPARGAEQRSRAIPWTLGLMAYQGQYSTSWQLVLAFITLTILPAILMFLMAQKYIVAGSDRGRGEGVRQGQ